jgi:26S proteasome regulatory subunit N2
VQHGNCLGLGLAAMGSAKTAHFDRLGAVLLADNAVAGEAAGLGMGLVMLGSANPSLVAVMLQYAQETPHETIIRGLGLGLALVMYNAQEDADGLIRQLSMDKDALLRMAAAHTLAMAYVGTGDNTAIARLLLMSRTDVSDDVRRMAVTALGFVLCRTPSQVPSVVAPFTTSSDAQVRVGACMALAIACANTGSAEALALLEPMFSDAANFVRQGAYIAAALVLMQQPNSNPKAAATRAQLAKIATSSGQDILAKFGAIYAQGLLECGTPCYLFMFVFILTRIFSSLLYPSTAQAVAT